VSRKKVQKGKPAAEWGRYFRQAGVLADKLENTKSARAKNTVLGNFLAQNVGREVPIEVRGRTGTARLCCKHGRANQKRYYLQVTWDKPARRKKAPKLRGSASDQADGPPKAEVAKKQATQRRKVAKGKQKPAKQDLPAVGAGAEGAPSVERKPAKGKQPARGKTRRKRGRPDEGIKKTDKPPEGNQEEW
jgi:hypothetical protein